MDKLHVAHAALYLLLPLRFNFCIKIQTMVLEAFQYIEWASGSEKDSLKSVHILPKETQKLTVILSIGVRSA